MSGLDIRLRHPQALLNSLGRYGQQLIDLLRDAASGRSDLLFRIQP